MSMDPTLFLHGALGTSDQLKRLAKHLDVKQPKHRLNFEGHGSGAIPDRPFRIEHFAEELERRHPAGWEEVAAKTKDLLLDLGSSPRISDSDWEEIGHKVRIHTGDRDTTAGIEQSLDVCKKLKNGELMVLPSTPHPIERADLKLLACSLNDFFC